ncbi:MAG: 4-hydroxy-3-methylbut-2-enyl diphosphate reductase [Gammaproteobacteria bacterium]
MQVILARPRGFCAGVVRAVEIVERALEIYGVPVYVLHEIVHNAHVVEDLQSRGAVFVESLNNVPRNALVIFSAHGVSRAVVERSERKQLQVINATCPLVTKVHLEVARYARDGFEVVLVGHAGHPEVIGTLGCYNNEDGGIYLVETVEDVQQLRVMNARKIGYVTQTTLSVDDTARIVAALAARFPKIVGPRKDDICYATQNRQNAVRKFAGQVDILLVVGARNSSNSNRLREVGEQLGLPSYLVQDSSDIDAAWLRRADRIGVTAGASAPEALVQGVLERLRELGHCDVHEMEGEAETTTFRLPAELLKKKAGSRETAGA